jgi:hypothetical protein
MGAAIGSIDLMDPIKTASAVAIGCCGTAAVGLFGLDFRLQGRSSRGWQ